MMQNIHYLFISREWQVLQSTNKLGTIFLKYILSLQDDLVSCMAREMIKKTRDRTMDERAGADPGFFMRG